MDNRTIRICEKCNKPLPNGMVFCPECGFEQKHGGIELTKIPQTISELKQFCESKGMPLERMRFFIGEDYREAKAFGIYQDENGEFVVYKNKADGSRAIRYRGTDEAFAVRELYEKLKFEIDLRRGNGTRQNTVKSSIPRGLRVFIVLWLVLVFFIVSSNMYKEKYTGYYRYHNQVYYSVGYQDWYYYSNSVGDWLPTEQPFNRDYYSECYIGKSYSDALNDDYWDGSAPYFSDFRNSDYYDDYNWSSDSSGSSYDSWDSGSTDWDSDW